MVHDRMMRRQLLATLAILACGLVPDRLAGAGPARLRASLASGLFNRADASRIERGYYEQLLDDRPAARRPGRPAGPARPPSRRRHLRAPRSTRPRWSSASTTSARWR